MSAISTLPCRIRRLTRPALLCLLGCAHVAHRSPNAETVPAMPSPLGQIYTRALTEPGDSVVSSAMHGLPWDEVLSGAASGVALAMLQGEKPTPYWLRWHAVLAAWPYPLVGFYTARVAYGEVPKDLIADARLRAAAGQDLGVVRARDADGDLWVLLASQRTTELGPLPRDPEVGSSLQLLGARFLLVDPEGERHVQEEGSFKVDEAGVWLVEAQAPDGSRIASFPLFAGGKPPQVPPVEAEVSGLTEAAALAVLDDIRAWYQFPTLARDAGLDSVARARLRGLRDGGLPPAENSLRAAGFVDVPVAGAECHARTIAACLDGLWWTPDQRRIFAPDLNSVGVAVESDSAGVTVVLVAAG